MTIDEIKELIQVVKDTGIAGLEVQKGDDRVKIWNSVLGAQEIGAGQSAGLAGAPVSTYTVSNGAVTAPTEAASAAAKEDDRNILVKSPIVGTYYDAPEPGAAPFVKTGDRVEPKQVLCIIESMKLMNEIEAEVRGTIVAKHLENGRPVEYGESLFTIQPL